MTQLGDVFPLADLEYAITERLVVRREHSRYPLAILNYTERCQYERGLWGAVTLQCRGLIYRTDTLEVVARPFAKFFNYGQEGAPDLSPDAAVCVSDKLDGSLGILYPTPDGWAIATRGSFESDQALHATALWRERFADYYPSEGVTLLFEIVYPENRIVLDYGERDDLILLGGVRIADGSTVGLFDAFWADWPGSRADTFPYGTLRDALDAPPRQNAEGLVIHFLDADQRVKVKQEDYVALHRIVTGLNERTVWEHLSEGKPLADLLAPLPDEFHVWVGEVADRLVATVEGDAREVELAYSTILAALPPDFTRKDFAQHAAPHPLKWALFSRLDGKDYHAGLWKNAKPEAMRGPRAYSEDTA